MVQSWVIEALLAASVSALAEDRIGIVSPDATVQRSQRVAPDVLLNACC